MTQEVHINRCDIQLIQDELLKHSPDEACGALIGYLAAGKIKVKKVMPVKNSRPSDRSFELDATEHYKAWDLAEKEGMDIVGIYHTHPHSRAAPSLWDKKTMEIYPTLWIIAGTDGIKGYDWDEDTTQVKIVEIIQ